MRSGNRKTNFRSTESKTMGIDFSLLGQNEITQWLVDIIKIDTTNPPGNELPVAEYLAGVLQKEGYEPEIIESEEKRATLYLRIPGNSGKPKLLLMSHSDVVPAEINTWSHPPFSGKIVAGEIWGRGALDCKGLVVMELATVVAIKRSNFVPEHDLIYMVVPDEEAGGDMGAKYMVENHPEKVKVPYLINEGGGGGLKQKNKWLFTISNAEKGAFWAWVKVFGTPGHGSVPRASKNALYDLAKVIRILEKHKTRINPTEDVLKQIELLGGGKLAKFIFSHQKLADYILSHPIGKLKEAGAMLDAMIRPTIAVTMAEGSDKVNVIPGEARVGIDARLLPGQDWQDLKEELNRALKGKIKYEIKRQEGMGMPGNSSPFETPLKDVIQKVLTRHEPTAQLVPYQLTGATDSRFFREAFKTVAYGFMPFKIEGSIDEVFSQVHGRNERISIENLIWGSRVLTEVVGEFLSTP